MSRGVAATVNTEMMLLGSAFKAVVREGILLRSPAEGLRLLKEKDSVPAMELTPGEVRRLLRVTEPWLHPYLVGYAYTGARRGELFEVSWRDVTFRPGSVRLLNLKTHRDSRDRDRLIPMHPKLRKVLEVLKERRELEQPWPPVPAENLRRSFKAAVKAAGLALLSVRPFAPRCDAALLRPRLTSRSASWRRPFRREARP
ncbi:MAG: hypothetical protein L0170_15085, partial [Acidobacteria bacterium]|nr:hypothetical protein [Acidobacteriota bacterium]